MVELLKQPQYHPMNVVDQVMSIYAGSEGYLDDVPVKEIQKFEQEFLRFVHEQRSELPELLAREKKMTDAVVEKLKAALTEFKTRYRSSSAQKPALAPAAAAV
jgi:F-type H+-transporting ATPase subunit alpha